MSSSFVGKKMKPPNNRTSTIHHILQKSNLVQFKSTISAKQF